MDDIVVKTIEHHQQNDHVIINPLGKDRPKEWRLPRTQTHLLVQGQTWLLLSFLYRVGFTANTFLPQTLETALDLIRDDIVDYKLKYSNKKDK